MISRSIRTGPGDRQSGSTGRALSELDKVIKRKKYYEQEEAVKGKTWGEAALFDFCFVWASLPEAANFLTIA